MADGHKPDFTLPDKAFVEVDGHIDDVPGVIDLFVGRRHNPIDTHSGIPFAPGAVPPCAE